jgi:hypothetical protein
MAGVPRVSTKKAKKRMVKKSKAVQPRKRGKYEADHDND